MIFLFINKSFFKEKIRAFLSLISHFSRKTLGGFFFFLIHFRFKIVNCPLPYVLCLFETVNTLSFELDTTDTFEGFRFTKFELFEFL